MSAPAGEASRPQRGMFLRVIRAWNNLPRERRLASLAALGLIVTLFLPWYQETVIASGGSALRSASASLTGWGAFSFVEAAVLLVAAGVLVLLFIRAEGGAFHVPGGDGGVVTAAGLWAGVLILWRMFDKEGTTAHGQYTTTSGIEWGIFVALAVAGLLAYAGMQIRRAHEPEPPLPGEPGASAAPGGRRARRGRTDALPRAAEPGRPGPDMEADDTWIYEPEGSAPSGAPTVRDSRRGRDSGAPSEPRSSRPLGRRDVDDLDIHEPPTGRFDSLPLTSEPRTKRFTDPGTTRRGTDRQEPNQPVTEADSSSQRAAEAEVPTEAIDPEPPTDRS